MPADNCSFGKRFCSGWLLLVLLCPLLVGTQVAQAQQPSLVAFAPFDGRELAKPPKKPIEPGFTASVVFEALQARSHNKPYRVLAPDLWTGMARVKNHGRVTDIVGVAKLLSARLIVAGYLESTTGPEYAKPYRLNVTVYGADGGLQGQLSFDLERSLLQPAAFDDKASAIQQLIEQSLQRQPLIAEPVTPPQVATGRTRKGSVATMQPVAAGPVPQADDAEPVRFDPNEPKQSLVPLTEEAREQLLRRPPWQAAIDLQVGYVYSARLFTNEGTELRFGRSGAHGMALLGELHPLALLPNVGPWLAGLGLRAQVVLPFWPDIAHVMQVGQVQTGTYTATEYRYDIALREHINPWDALLRPDFAVELLYGEHSFTTAAKMNIDYLRVPPSDYRYLGGALHMRMFFTQRFSLTAGAMAAKLLSLGLMTRSGNDMGDMLAARDRNGFLSYGAGDGFQWRVEAAGQVNVYRGLTFGARFFYEQNRLSFEGDGNVLQANGQPVTRVFDEYLGVMATIGYVFQPRLNRTDL